MLRDGRRHCPAYRPPSRFPFLKSEHKTLTVALIAALGTIPHAVRDTADWTDGRTETFGASDLQWCLGWMTSHPLIGHNGHDKSPSNVSLAPFPIQTWRCAFCIHNDDDGRHQFWWTRVCVCVRAGARLARYRLSIGGLQQTGNRRADYRFVGLRFLLRLWTRSLPTAVMSLFPHTRPLLPVNLFMDSLPVPNTHSNQDSQKIGATSLSLSLFTLPA